MSGDNPRRLQRWASCAALVVVVFGLAKIVATNALAQVPCTPGPILFESLADFTLPDGVQFGAKVSLTRVTLQPGETLDQMVDGYSAYFVESGSGKYELKPGLGTLGSAVCGSSGGMIQVDDAGMALLVPGQALQSEEVPVGLIRNAGNVPLVLLVMRYVPAQIDPETGEPMLDPATAGRIAARERDQLREACKTGAAGTDTASVTGTPSADEELARALREGEWVPKACREERTTR